MFNILKIFLARERLPLSGLNVRDGKGLSQGHAFDVQTKESRIIPSLSDTPGSNMPLL